MSGNKFWEWWEQYSGYVFGPVLMILAVLCNKFVRPYWATHFMDDLIVALIIAGILATTVDPFVKRSARREATRDIFHHMLGYSLPPIIRERLQNIVEKTKFYRESTAMRIAMSEEKDSIVFSIEMDFEIVNPTPHTLPFVPFIQFEKGEQAVLTSVTCFGEDQYDRGAKLSPAEGRLGSKEYRGRAIEIPSASRRKFKYEYAVKYPASLGFWYPNFQYPTIGLSLTIKSPQNFVVTATPADNESPGEWRYTSKLFMPGEHLDIVWDKVS